MINTVTLKMLYFFLLTAQYRLAGKKSITLFFFLTLLTAKYRFAGNNVSLYFLCSKGGPLDAGNKVTLFPQNVKRGPVRRGK